MPPNPGQAVPWNPGLWPPASIPPNPGQAAYASFPPHYDDEQAAPGDQEPYIDAEYDMQTARNPSSPEEFAANPPQSRRRNTGTERETGRTDLRNSSLVMKWLVREPPAERISQGNYYLETLTGESRDAQSASYDSLVGDLTLALLLPESASKALKSASKALKSAEKAHSRAVERHDEYDRRSLTRLEEAESNLENAEIDLIQAEREKENAKAGVKSAKESLENAEISISSAMVKMVEASSTNCMDPDDSEIAQFLKKLFELDFIPKDKESIKTQIRERVMSTLIKIDGEAENRLRRELRELNSDDMTGRAILFNLHKSTGRGMPLTEAMINALSYRGGQFKAGYWEAMPIIRDEFPEGVLGALLEEQSDLSPSPTMNIMQNEEVLTSEFRDQKNEKMTDPVVKVTSGKSMARKTANARGWQSDPRDNEDRPAILPDENMKDLVTNWNNHKTAILDGQVPAPLKDPITDRLFENPVILCTPLHIGEKKFSAGQTMECSILLSLEYPEEELIEHKKLKSFIKKLYGSQAQVQQLNTQPTREQIQEAVQRECRREYQRRSSALEDDAISYFRNQDNWDGVENSILNSLRDNNTNWNETTLNTAREMVLQWLMDGY